MRGARQRRAPFLLAVMRPRYDLIVDRRRDRHGREITGLAVT